MDSKHSKNIDSFLSQTNTIHQSFDECKICLEDIHQHAAAIINTPLFDTDFDIKLGQFPQELYTFRKNLFSSLFQASYALLGVDKSHRLLYGKLNYLFRIWVTAVDNLLDNENKVTLPLILPKNSRVIKETVSLMTADRVLSSVLAEAQSSNLINKAEADLISKMTLQILLPSAGEEATEEGGVLKRYPPQHTLETIHQFKTGMLFRVPFVGVEIVEKQVAPHDLEKCKEGLYKFGLGCQLLDDIRDISRDFLEGRHNYVISKIIFEEHTKYAEQLEQLKQTATRDTKVFDNFTDAVNPTAELAFTMLQDGLGLLNELGLGLNKKETILVIYFLFTALDVGELWKNLEQKAAL